MSLGGLGLLRMRLRPNVGKLLLREGSAFRAPTAIDDPLDYSNGSKLFENLKDSLRKISILENWLDWIRQIIPKALRIILIAHSRS